MTESTTGEEHARSLCGEVIAERYRLDDVIAMGGMGAVYRGTHIHMRKPVAIKLLHAKTRNLPAMVERFERESVVGAHASHPNVAAATDFGKLRDGGFYLVLELVDGISLKALSAHRPMPLDRALTIARQIAEGLAAIHELGIVHRDLKPGNVMVIEGKPDKVKLIDFGLAKVPMQRFEEAPNSLAVTSQDLVFGTVGFIAPEARFGMSEVSQRSDLYALGVILYDLIAGRRPFEADDERELFRQHIEDAVPPLKTRTGKSVPRAVEKLVMRLLEKQPEDRFVDARALCRALDEALERLEDDSRAAADHDDVDTPPDSDDAAAPSEDSAPAPESARAVAAPSRRRWPWLLALLVVSGVGLYAYLRRPWSQPLATASPATSTANSGHDTAPTASAPVAAATAPASATATARPAATARPTEIDGRNARQWRALLRRAALEHQVAGGAEALTALAKIAPQELRDHGVLSHAVTVVGDVSVADADAADALFALLADPSLEGHGLDVLYEVARLKGGSEAARRAEVVLHDAEAMRAASPALQVALALREAPCSERDALFGRAQAEGDERAALLLTEMIAPDCATRSGCCKQGSAGIAAALRGIRSRND